MEFLGHGVDVSLTLHETAKQSLSDRSSEISF